MTTAKRKALPDTKRENVGRIGVLFDPKRKAKTSPMIGSQAKKAIPIPYL